MNLIKCNTTLICMYWIRLKQQLAHWFDVTPYTLKCNRKKGLKKMAGYHIVLWCDYVIGIDNRIQNKQSKSIVQWILWASILWEKNSLRFVPSLYFITTSEQPKWQIRSIWTLNTNLCKLWWHLLAGKN